MKEPSPYHLHNKEEVKRLFKELESYMKVSLNDGTDRMGRVYALDALREINQGYWDVTLEEPEHREPTYNNEVL